MNMKKEKISIIIPIYNTEKYLGTCLQSCISQTLRDIEIICVNDGSTDQSESIVRLFQESDPRIKLISKENGGLSSARNTGIRAAHGEMLVFLDSDDYLSRNACERIWAEEKETEADIIIFGSKWFPVYPGPDRWITKTLQVETAFFSEFSSKVLFDQKGAKPFVWRQAFRGDFLESIGLLFDERVIFGEDLVFQMEAFPNAKRFCFISDELYNYRWSRPGSLMASADEDISRKHEYHLDNLELICEYWSDRNWFEAYGDDFIKWMIRLHIVDVLKQDGENARLHFQHLQKIINKYQLNRYMQHLDDYHQNCYLRYTEILERSKNAAS